MKKSGPSPLPKLPAPERCHEVEIFRPISSFVPLSKSTQTEYTLKSNPVKYQLPSPKKLKPYVDHIPGKYETWPAHASKIPSGCESNNTHSNEPAPEFVAQLDNWLCNELNSIKQKTDCQQEESRLLVYSQLFDCIINNFKTYKKPLASIKFEYEATIERLRRKINDLESLEGMAANLAEQCQQKVLDAKQDERGTISHLEGKIQQMSETIKSLREDKKSAQIQIAKLQFQLAEEYKKFRHEGDARKLLVQDLNELRAYHENSKRTANEGGDNTSTGDAVMLEIALRQARNDLSKKTKELNTMTANYGDVVPRSDYEKITDENKATAQQCKDLISENERLTKETRKLQEVHSYTQQQLKETQKELKMIQRCATPRPDWSRCGAHMEGGAERWSNISKGESSDYKVDLLLCEITGQDISIIQANRESVIDHFVGLGFEEGVPPYLQTEEKVINRHISKNETIKLIADIWKSRREYLKNNGNNRDHLSEYLSIYLNDKHSKDSGAVFEDAYNLHDACTRYMYNTYIATFSNILNGMMNESVVEEQDKYIQDVEQLMTDRFKDIKTEDSNKDEVTQNILKDIFSLKSAEEIVELIQSLQNDIGQIDCETSLDIAFSKKSVLARFEVLHRNFPALVLLEDTRKARINSPGGNGQMPSLFIMTILEQEYADKEIFLSSLEKILIEEGETTVASVKAALKQLDTGISEQQTIKYLCQGLQVESNQLMDNGSVDIHVLLRNLKYTRIGLMDKINLQGNC